MSRLDAGIAYCIFNDNPSALLVATARHTPPVSTPMSVTFVPSTTNADERTFMSPTTMHLHHVVTGLRKAHPLNHLRVASLTNSPEDFLRTQVQQRR